MTNTRVKLLPWNYFFAEDAALVRKAFGIPDGQIGDIALDQFPNRRPPWDGVRVLDTGAALDHWLLLRQCWLNKIQEVPVECPPLPKWFLQTVKATPRFDDAQWPKLLRKPPVITQRYARRYHLEDSLDRAAACLVGRYGLPWTCGGNVRLFLLTEQVRYLQSIQPFDVTVHSVKRQVGEALLVVIDWVDEFTTKKQWDDIWETSIGRRQRFLWERRGEQPHSRQVEIAGFVKDLDQPWVLEPLKRMNAKHIGVDAALDELSKEERLPEDSVDPSKARRVISKLLALTKPLNG